MTDAPAPAPTPAPAPAPAPAAPWYEGKADADMIGHWDNKAWNKSDPVTIAIEATKQAREAQKHFGVPADQLLKLPKDTADDAGWAAVYERLGAPKDAKDYDFSAVKHADGNAPDAKLLDTIRATAASLRVSKDKAPDLAKAVVAHLDSVKAEQTAVAAANLATEKAALAQSWGANAEMNKLQAMQGAKRLGLTPEAVSAMESQIGYAATMEAMRKIGALGAEDPFVQGGTSGSGNPATREGAQARLNELVADKAWGARLSAGDAAAKREFESLTQLIAA
jgi:hypothetical protein